MGRYSSGNNQVLDALQGISRTIRGGTKDIGAARLSASEFALKELQAERQFAREDQEDSIRRLAADKAQREIDFGNQLVRPSQTIGQLSQYGLSEKSLKEAAEKIYNTLGWTPTEDGHGKLVINEQGETVPLTVNMMKQRGDDQKFPALVMAFSKADKNIDLRIKELKKSKRDPAKLKELQELKKDPQKLNQRLLENSQKQLQLIEQLRGMPSLNNEYLDRQAAVVMKNIERYDKKIIDPETMEIRAIQKLTAKLNLLKAQKDTLTKKEWAKIQTDINKLVEVKVKNQIDINFDSGSKWTKNEWAKFRADETKILTDQYHITGLLPAATQPKTGKEKASEMVKRLQQKDARSKPGKYDEGTWEIIEQEDASKPKPKKKTETPAKVKPKKKTKTPAKVKPKKKTPVKVKLESTKISKIRDMQGQEIPDFAFDEEPSQFADMVNTAANNSTLRGKSVKQILRYLRRADR